MTIEEEIKWLLDIYDRFEEKKSAQGAMDFVRRNINAGCEPVVLPLPAGDIDETELRRMFEADACMPVAVDLGLPSGRLWADRNVGAKKPEDFGLYFSWGSVDGVRHGEECDFSKDIYEKTGVGEICGDLKYEEDAAFVNLGELWRMPTEKDFVELSKHCSHVWTECNGIKGMLFTSKTNSNSIFLPATGYVRGRSWEFPPYEGNYWSCSFSSARYARSFFIDKRWEGGVVIPQSYKYRCLGLTVRPVQK